MFAQFNKEAEEKDRNQVAEVQSMQVEAYQLCRKIKTGSGSVHREVIDTVRVEKGNAFIVGRKMLLKSENIPGSFVVEKLERVVTFADMKR